MAVAALSPRSLYDTRERLHTRKNTWRWSGGLGLDQARACIYFKNSSSPVPVRFGVKILSRCQQHTQNITEPYICI
jgi:hypothetical protein